MGRRPPSPVFLFDSLPKQRRPRSPAPSSPVQHSEQPPQPDLLDWTPPPTHLMSGDVEACILDPSGFRPPAGEAFLYHLTDLGTARSFLADGLPLADALMFRSALHLAEDLSDILATGEVGILRVRRRLILPWLRADRQDGRPCYVLVPQTS